LSPDSGAIKPKPQEEVPPAGPLVDPTWSEPIDAEGVVNAWSDFVQKLRDDDQLALVATMSAHQPTLSGHKVSFVVNNPLQREQMDGLRTEVLVHLKTALQNAQLELSLAMREQPMEEKKAFLSDKDRYELMAEKNPSLEKLRKALDLDLA
jgi:DNA polymerase-3 subunit gamma/tau